MPFDRKNFLHDTLSNATGGVITALVLALFGLLGIVLKYLVPSVWAQLSKTTWLPGWALVGICGALATLAFLLGRYSRRQITAPVPDPVPVPDSAPVTTPTSQQKNEREARVSRAVQQIDDVERAVLRVFVDLGKRHLDVREFLAAFRAPQGTVGSIRPWNVVEQLAARGYVDIHSGPTQEYTAVLDSRIFAEVLGNPGAVGSTRPPKVLLD